MRTIAILTATALLAFTSCRQNRAVENADATDPQEWPQLDEFHFVMAESFHPYADSGNLEPARKYAAELASLSETWAREPLPEKVNDETTRALLNELSRETAAFREMASTASDDSLGASLTSIHDLFHKIQDSWYSSAHVDPEH
ncbi:MAG: hypothetical protein LOY03_01405 [Cyclobacteriaceae bacterium]|jgi:hypothetical protein|nr:hypothetical protein [Cyclobacteriaceae bacterium]